MNALETAALHYRRVMELVEHYRSVLTLRYLPIRYEDIVDDQAQSIRRMLEFIGEPFDDRCLAFHENRRYAPTPSYAQVTEKLHDRSIGRHKHYAQQLGPHVARLRKMLAADNGISTSHFQLYDTGDGNVAITLNNFCKLQDLGPEDEDDILSCVSFLLADVVHAQEFIGADLAKL